jgi:hypothetical protein
VSKLNAARRRAVPKSSFALPGGSASSDGKPAYPIQDKSHAVAALARVEQHGTPSEKATVRAAVARKYPGLPSSRGQGGSRAASANRKSVPRGKTGMRRSK